MARRRSVGAVRPRGRYLADDAISPKSPAVDWTLVDAGLSLLFVGVEADEVSADIAWRLPVA